MSISRTEKEILKDIDMVDLQLKESRSTVNKLRVELLNAETTLIGDKLHKEKLQEELRRLRANSRNG